MSIAPLRTVDQLTVSAARMARAAPNSWDEFKALLAKLAQERAALCVQAPPDKIFNVQGQAQALQELETLFKDAPAQATLLEAKMKERANGR
jgi:hypothetical protein